MASSAGIASLTERQARSPLSRSVGGLTPSDAAGQSALTGPGSEPAMLIVPEADDLTVEVKLPPQNIDQLLLGRVQT